MIKVIGAENSGGKISTNPNEILDWLNIGIIKEFYDIDNKGPLTTSFVLFNYDDDTGEVNFDNLD